MSQATTENLRSLVMQTRKQMDVLTEHTRRQAKAYDARIRNRPYQFASGVLVAGIATGTLLGLAFRRK